MVGSQLNCGFHVSAYLCVALHLAVAHGIQSALDARGGLRLAIRGVFMPARKPARP